MALNVTQTGAAAAAAGGVVSSPPTGNTNQTSMVTGGGLIPYQVHINLMMLWAVTWLFILPPGLFANLLNMRTFLRMGLDESVTISFFFLALSDFAHLFFPLANIVIMCLLYVEATFLVFFKIQPVAMLTYVLNFGALFNTLTSFITAYLAVQRCLCIVLPFRFKTMFTKGRTWCVMAILTVISLTYDALYMTGYTMVPMTLPFNRTQYVLFVLPSFKTIRFYVDTIFFMVINVSCQALSLVSLIVMTLALAASVRFRKDATSSVGKPSRAKKVTDNKVNDVSDRNNNSDNDAKQVETDRQNSKERTAIVQVALLSAVYLVSSLPKLFLAFGSVFVEEFRFGGQYTNFFFQSICIRITTDYVNSSVNFLIYYKYNSKFRKLCFNKVSN